MKTVFRLFLFAVACAVLFSAVAFFSSEKVLRVKDGKVISFGKMIDEIRGSSIIIVGENHDDKTHHAAQLAVIRSLYRARPLAVGMEMFPAESQKHLDSWVDGSGDASEFIRLYYRNWKMPWPLYRDILLYVREHRIPLLGLNVPIEVTKRVAAEGFAALTPAEKRRLPLDTTCNVDPAYMEFIRSAFRAHKHNGKSFVHFCETQRLWNRSMAWYLIRYLEKNPQRSVVVVTGAGHAVKRAIPAEVKDLSGPSATVILPEMNEMPLNEVTSKDADYVILHR